MSSYSSILPSSNGTNTIYLLFGVFFLVWYLQCVWSRRKLYKWSRKVNGPLSLPIIGAGHKYFFSRGIIYYIILLIIFTIEFCLDLMTSLNEMAEKYSGFYCIWFAHKLKYILSQPDHIDIVLNSPNAISKDEVYEFFEEGVGQGLFTAHGNFLKYFLISFLIKFCCPIANIWKSKRKIISAFLSQANLQQYINGTAKYAQFAVNNFKELMDTGKEIDVDLEVTNISLSTIFGRIFS